MRPAPSESSQWSPPVRGLAEGVSLSVTYVAASLAVSLARGVTCAWTATTPCDCGRAVARARPASPSSMPVSRRWCAATCRTNTVGCRPRVSALSHLRTTVLRTHAVVRREREQCAHAAAARRVSCHHALCCACTKVYDACMRQKKKQPPHDTRPDHCQTGATACPTATGRARPCTRVKRRRHAHLHSECGTHSGVLHASCLVRRT